MKLLSFFVLVMFGVTASNATFHRKNHLKHFFTMDMNGFHNHNHGAAYQELRDQYLPPPPLPIYRPPPPIYGPPSPFYHPHYHHYHHHHKPTPHFNYKPEDGMSMTNTNIMSIPYNPMPFIPNINNPMPSITNPVPSDSTIFNPFNFPFDPQNFYTPNPNTYNAGDIPSNTIQQNNNNNNLGYDSDNSVNNPTNLPADQLPTSESVYDTNTIRPLDANTALYPGGQTTPSVFNADNQPQYPTETSGPTEATTSQFATNNNNNNNNYSGNGAATANNNDIDITNNNPAIVPGVTEPTTTTTAPSSTQGNDNGLDYDIDIRFGNSKPNNSSNQKAADTIK